METLWAECRGQGRSPKSPMWWAEAMVLDTASQCPALPAEDPREVTFSPMRWVRCWHPAPHGVMRMALNSTHMEPRAELAPCRGAVSASCPLAPLPIPSETLEGAWQCLGILSFVSVSPP